MSESKLFEDFPNNHGAFAMISTIPMITRTADTLEQTVTITNDDLKALYVGFGKANDGDIAFTTGYMKIAQAANPEARFLMVDDCSICPEFRNFFLFEATVSGIKKLKIGHHSSCRGQECNIDGAPPTHIIVRMLLSDSEEMWTHTVFPLLSTPNTALTAFGLVSREILDLITSRFPKVKRIDCDLEFCSFLFPLQK